MGEEFCNHRSASLQERYQVSWMMCTLKCLVNSSYEDVTYFEFMFNFKNYLCTCSLCQNKVGEIEVSVHVTDHVLKLPFHLISVHVTDHEM